METSVREHLLRGVRQFIKGVSAVSGIESVSLLGSLTTSKQEPKDADLLVRVSPEVDWDSLAMLGRKLKGHAQRINAGADIFLCTGEGEYIGRTCSYKECRPRVACRGTECGRGARICNDLHVITLESGLVRAPPVDLWPTVVVRTEVPSDVRSILLD